MRSGGGGARLPDLAPGHPEPEGAKRIGFAQFKQLARRNSSLIQRAIQGTLAVPDFAALSSDVDGMYRDLLPIRSGAVADYIPQLRRVDPEQLAIAVCTVDGQRFSVGSPCRVLPAVGVQGRELLPGAR
jgi:glutaminase